MIIEVGKTYNVSNKNKNTVVEVEMYRHKEESLKGVNTQIVWKSGGFIIEITSEEEAESLQDMLDGGGEFCTDCFDTVSMEYCWDGFGEDLVPWTTAWSSGEFEEFLNEYYDSEYGGYDFLIERDFEPMECIWYIANGITVEETVI